MQSAREMKNLASQNEIKNVKIQSIFSEIPYTKTDICNRVSVFIAVQTKDRMECGI